MRGKPRGATGRARPTSGILACLPRRLSSLAILLVATAAALVALLAGHRELRTAAALQEQVISDLRTELEVLGSRLAAQEWSTVRLSDSLRDLRTNVVADRQATKVDARQLAAIQPQKVRAGGGNKLLWPASGRVTSGFSDRQGYHGIDIAAWIGMPVRAAAKGTVVPSTTTHGGDATSIAAPSNQRHWFSLREPSYTRRAHNA